MTANFLSVLLFGFVALNTVLSVPLNTTSTLEPAIDELATLETTTDELATLETTKDELATLESSGDELATLETTVNERAADELATLQPRADEPELYGILLDAGSSSTKLKIYKWTPSSTSSGVPQIRQVSLPNNRFKPGLADFGDDISAMTTYLTSVLDTAQNAIPVSQHSETPLYLLATAGFRLLGLNDAQGAMSEVEDILMNATLHPFTYQRGDASVLSGEEEAVYAWLAANYMRGFFDNIQPDSAAVGVLEMGGGSTQIAFIPTQPLLAEEFQVRMAGRKYSLYVQSYLKFGATEVKQKVVEHLIRAGQGYVSTAHPNHTMLDHPCMLRGDSLEWTLDDGTIVLANGTGEPEVCREIYRKLLASAPPEKCNLEPCAIGSVFQPSVSGINFLATQAYTYPLLGIGAVNDTHNRLDLVSLWGQVEAYCNKSISEFPGQSSKWASSNCMGSVYIDTLLTGPYGFPRDTQHIHVEKDVDWALGAMLELLSMRFTNNPNHCSVSRK